MSRKTAKSLFSWLFSSEKRFLKAFTPRAAMETYWFPPLNKMYY